MLSRELILQGLKRLGELLKAQGEEGEILLTGGAAMCLVHNARDMTKDVDALYEPKPIINELAGQVAKEKGLPADWLNDGVKGYLTPNAPTNEFLTFDGLKVTTVSPEYLLAMKLMASRQGEKDMSDIAFLLDKLNIQTFDDAKELLTAHFPQDRILPKTRYVLEEYFTTKE
jgi:predicted nucleotidyltransferase